MSLVVRILPSGADGLITFPLAEEDTAILARWLHGRALHTQRAYRADVLRFLAHAAKPLADVTLADLHAFADALAATGLAPASQVRRLAAVKSVLAFAHATGDVSHNVGHALRLPAVRAELAARIPTEDDVLALLAHEPNRRNHALIRLLYAAGLRVSEVCALRWCDLQPRGEAGQVTVWGKGAKERAILLTVGTWHEILALRPTDAHLDDPIFRSRRGRPLSSTQAWRIVKGAARRAGLVRADAFSPHWLRHAHASHALDRGAPLSLVREGLGHTSLAATSRYVHARPGDSAGRYLPI